MSSNAYGNYTENFSFAKAWQQESWQIGGLFSLLSAVFLGWRLGGWDRFLIRPGEQVSDFLVTFWPNIHYLRQTWLETGHVSLWRTLIFSGSPLVGDPQSGLGYWFNLIFFLFPEVQGLNFLLWLHLVLGALGMWFWARGNRLGRAGSLLTGMAWLFFPRLYAHWGLGHVGLVYASTWIPWALMAGQWIGQGRWRWGAVLGVILGWQMSNHPQIALYTVATAAILGSMEVWQRRGKFLRFLSVLGGAGVLAVLVSAPTLLPVLQLAPLTGRAGMGEGDAAVSSLPWGYLLGIVFPDYRGYADYQMYLGAPLFALFSVGVLVDQEKRKWVGLLALMLTYALGSNLFVYRGLLALFPMLTWLRAPSRIWVVMAPLAYLLAGRGLEYLMAEGLRKGGLLLLRIWGGLAATALFLAVGYAVLYGSPPKFLTAGACAFIVAWGMLVMAQRDTLRRWLPWVAVVLVGLDLLVMDASLVDGYRLEDAFTQRRALAETLVRMGGDEPFRVYSPSYSLPRHVAARYGLETADGVDPLYLASYDRLMALASGVMRRGYTVTVPAMEGDAPVEQVNRDAVPDSRLLGLLNVRFVVAEFPINAPGLRLREQVGGTYLYENEKYLPRAFLVKRVVPVSSVDQTLDGLSTQDPKEVAFVEDGRMLSTNAGGSDVMWLERTPDRLRLRISAADEAFLVLSQTWYPGWVAWIGDRPVPLYRVDGALSGVYVPAGNHVVTLVFQPTWYVLGFWLSLASHILVGWMMLRYHARY